MAHSQHFIALFSQCQWDSGTAATMLLKGVAIDFFFFAGWVSLCPSLGAFDLNGSLYLKGSQRCRRNTRKQPLETILLWGSTTLPPPIKYERSTTSKSASSQFAGIYYYMCTTMCFLSISIKQKCVIILKAQNFSVSMGF